MSLKFIFFDIEFSINSYQNIYKVLNDDLIDAHNQN